MFHHIATGPVMTSSHCYKINFAPATFGSKLLISAALCAALLGCSNFDTRSARSTSSSSQINPVNWITPYRMDVIQGNFVSKEQIEALKPGMTRAQVRDLLGTPLLASLFHADRWDYVFTLRRQGVEPQAFKYAVFFKADQLERFEGDTMPSDAEFISTLANNRKIGKVPVLQVTEEQLNAAQKVSASAGSTPSTSAKATAAAPELASTPPGEFPPLEKPSR